MRRLLAPLSVILALLLLVHGPVVRADEETTATTQAVPEKADKEKQVAVVNSICSSCKCGVAEGYLDCSDRNLALNFKDTDFVALNASFALTNVYFKYNQIKNISVYPSVTIVTLDLSNNQISLIQEGAFANLPLLAELDLSYNRLQSDALTPQVFQGKYDPTVYEPLKMLRVLKLAGNDIHRLDPDLFEHMVALEELDLSENPFSVIDPGTEIAISQIPKLKKLNLAETQIKALPEHIFHAPRGLIEIDLTGNLFERIPGALIFAINLETLILDDNPIVRIGSKTSKFPVLTKLRKLSISDMKSLERIENHGLSNLENLEELVCSGNSKLTYVSSGALSRPGKEEPSDVEWPNLKKLYLSNNNISVLDSDFLGRWDNVEEIDLSGNPWLCDCKTQWIIDILLERYGKSQRNVKDVVCEYPLENNGVKMVDLEHQKLKCVNFKDGRVTRDGAVLVGILIGVLVGVPIALMLFLIYKRGCFGLMSQGPADFSRAFYKRTAQDDMNF